MDYTQDADVPTCYHPECADVGIILWDDGEDGMMCPECGNSYVRDENGNLEIM